jgi:hypothetical protein
MKILVPVKRVVDYNIKIRIMADGSGVELANVSGRSLAALDSEFDRRWSKSLHKDTIRSVTPAKSPNKLVDILAPT